MRMDTWLKVKTAGLPRWAWVSLLSGAVVLGLYLRTRTPAESEAEEEEEIEPEETGLGVYDGMETAGGLGSVGIAGPAGQQIVPVEAPFLPEGFTDLLAQQGSSNVEAQQIIGDLARAALEREPGERVEIITERPPSESSQGVTGGGAPKRKPHHKPPKKRHPKPRPKAHPKQHPRHPMPARPPRRRRSRIGVGPGHPAR